uniref:Uncharacterized protein n=1 Tax=Rhizophora mucronata TaxID=61149 RepID=A0A2P2NI82_RHIMU
MRYAIFFLPYTIQSMFCHAMTTQNFRGKMAFFLK